ncbi:Efflux pump notK' [Exophiala dermatitidis]
MGYNEWVHNANMAVARSFVGRRFRLHGSGHPKERKGSYFFTEIRAGLATFFAMAYIISVNSTIVSESGGTCVCPPDSTDLCDSNPEYMLCVAEIKRDLVTATAAISALTSFCMGLFANMPIALAPGMGLNAYFAYTVVGYHGSGLVPYQVAITAVFVEGLVFVGLTILGMRQWLARAIPASIKLATGVGIGLYLTLIGLTYSAGIGAVTGASDTPIELAGCHQDNLTDAGVCPSWDKMRNPTMWLGIFCGGIFTVILMMYRVKGAIIIGILLVSIISWPRNTPVTYFPYTELGTSMFDFFKKVVTFHPIQKILTVQEWDVSSYGGQFALAFISFLYVDILDTTGTLYSMARFCGAIDERTQDFEGSAVAYLVDAFGISIGALFGCPPVTAFIESGAGISEGGATGLTAMTTGFCFFISIFFAPIFASIPPYATGCVLIIVGSLMAKSAADINWRYIGDAVPAFLTIAIMPFTYSIAYGLIAGIISYIILNTVVWLIEIATGGRIRPADKKYKDPWTWKIEGGILPPWLVRASKGKRDFWRPYDDIEHNVVPRSGSHAAAAPPTIPGTHFGPTDTIPLEGREYYSDGADADVGPDVGPALGVGVDSRGVNAHHDTTIATDHARSKAGKSGSRDDGHGGPSASTSRSTSEEGEKVKM